MDFIILGIGVGLWMYSFITHRYYNKRPWLGSLPFFLVGVIIIIVGIILHFST